MKRKIFRVDNSNVHFDPSTLEAKYLHECAPGISQDDLQWIYKGGTMCGHDEEGEAVLNVLTCKD